jgi:chromosome partitioning protein
MRLISICNHKGGCGKSATATNLAACLALNGNHVLLIDLDPQCTATDAMGLDVENLGKQMYDVMVNEADLKDIVRPTEIPGLDIAPANMDLKVAEKQIEGQEGNEYILKNQIASLNDYDFIIMDSPPNIAPLTLNSMAIATELIIPIQCEYCSLRGMAQLMTVADMAEEAIKSLMLYDLIMVIKPTRQLFQETSKLQKDLPKENQWSFMLPTRLVQPHTKPWQRRC